MRGYFVVFEGGDGAGKSTQVRLLADRVRELTGSDPVVTREPGGTPLAEKIRALVLSDPDVDDLTEAYLFASARASHVTQRIRPALEAGGVVISDRFVGSSIAYQGAGRNLGEDTVAELNAQAVDGTIPDLTVVLDLSPQDALKRREDRNEATDRMESEALDFHTRLRDSFVRQAEQAPDRHLVVDARGSVEDIAAQIWQRVHADLMARGENGAQA